MATIQPPSLPWQASGTTFIAGRRLVVASTNETPITYFKATTKIMCWSVRNSFCWPDAESLVLSAYSDPTITNLGTAATPVNLRIGSTTKATVTVGSDPTASAYGTYLASMKVGSVGSTSGLLIVVDPGHSLLVTGTGSINGVDIGVGYSWYELDV